MDASKKNALISVFNKEGIVDFGRSLVELDWKLFSSGGTAKVLREGGLPVVDIATLVGPPILGHRVVTLAREIHAGLLAQDTPEDLAELQRINTPWFDLLYVDFYPLEAEIRRPGCTVESVIEKTDIGGPTMVRSAAKGRRLVITNANQRTPVLDRLRAGTADSREYRHVLAMHAERCVQRYCEVSANYLEASFIRMEIPRY